MSCRKVSIDDAAEIAEKYIQELEKSYHCENLAYKLTLQHEPAELHMHAYVMKERAWCRWQGAKALAEKIFGGKI